MNDKIPLEQDYFSQDVTSQPDAPEESKGNVRARNFSFIKLLAISACIVTVVILSTLSWFTMNRNVGGSGMSVKIKDALFELEVQGSFIENSSDFSKADTTYNLGVDQQELNPVKFRTSGASSEKIIWRKTGNTPDDGHYENGIEPDSHGKLTFWVVPDETGTLDLDFSFNIRGFIGKFRENEDENEPPILENLYEVNDDLTVANSGGVLQDNNDLATKKAALEYAKGHILFFSDYDSSTGYYSGFLGTAKTIRFGNCINPASNPKAKYNENNPVSVTAGQKYQVTIYWKWANTIEQMVFDNNSFYSDNALFSPSDSGSFDLIYSYLSNTTDNKVFSGISDADIDAHLTTIRSNSDITASLTDLSNGYDAADQLIGNNIDYIMIEMNAAAVS